MVPTFGGIAFRTVTLAFAVTVTAGVGHMIWLWSGCSEASTAM